MSLPSYVNELDLTNVDLADHHSLTRGIISLNVAFMMLVILVTAIRMSIRLFMVKAAGFDDCTLPHFLTPGLLLQKAAPI